jgi:hypothetical protein
MSLCKSSLQCGNWDSSPRSHFLAMKVLLYGRVSAYGTKTPRTDSCNMILYWLTNLLVGVFSEQVNWEPICFCSRVIFARWSSPYFILVVSRHFKGCAAVWTYENLLLSLAAQPKCGIPLVRTYDDLSASKILGLRNCYY